VNKHLGGKATSTFETNVRLVHDLMDFDRLVLDNAIRILQDIAQHPSLPNTAEIKISNALAVMATMSQRESLKIHYRHIYNQCVVLLVSYFGSAIRDLFVEAIDEWLRFGGNQELLQEELKVSVGELQSLPDESLAELFVAKKDISFQDMQSISRAFKQYLRFEATRDEHVNDIILGHACRHAIVHAGAEVDRRMMGQVKSARPRRLKETLTEGEILHFQPEEVRHLASVMTRYLNGLRDGVRVALESR